MLKEIKKKYHPFNHFLIRTPLFPLQMLDKFNEENLKPLFQNHVVSEAIFLASPVLHSECTKWLNNEIKEKKKEQRIVFSLMRYLLRMSTRCTPFGLFAGCTVGEWATNDNEQNALKEFLLSPQNEYKSHTRLDMHYLCALSQNLSNNPLIKDILKFYPNSSIYKCGTQLRYVEYRYVNKKRSHHLMVVDDSDYLQTILQAAKKGSDIKTMAELLVNNEISYEESKEFINELIESQLLVNELEPAITGPEFLEQILQVLKKIDAIDEIKETLIKTKQDIESIDNSILGIDVSKYLSIAENLKKLKTKYELNLLFQTDMIKPSKSNLLNKSYAEDVLKAIAIMNKFTALKSSTNLKQFREVFYERYEDKEVSLVEVLDTDTGIGYKQGAADLGDIAPLVDDIGIPYNGNGNSEIPWNSIESFLLKKYFKAYKQGLYEVSFTDKELEAFKNNYDDLPDTLAPMVQLYQDKLYISSAGGSSAANLLGRFCHSNNTIYDMTKEITAKENLLNPDVIFAEIIHLPESRTGNILLRPILRDYEIPYLAKAQVDKKHQILLNDLMISVKGNKIFLRSKRLNKEIIPRLSTAHNYSFNSLPIYHFLCDLQLQNGRGSVGFSWGVLRNEFTFLPRISYQNVILSLAQWNLRKENFEELIKCEENDLPEKIGEWCKKFNIPRYIALADGDNELVIDIENILCVKTFIDAIKKRPYIKLIEFLFDPETAIVKSEEGRFANQFIIPFCKIKESKQQENQDKVFDGIDKIPKRTFTIGDEWLYYKFYTGAKTADSILTDVLKPVTKQLLSKKIVDKWFFIRYADHDLHLRVRFHLPDLNKIGDAIKAIKYFISPFTSNNLIWETQTDTYQRELERYGPNTMKLSESLFFHDSVMIVNIIDMIEGDEGEIIRWLFGLRTIDALLDDFQYKMEQKLELLETLKNSFGKEFGINRSLKKQLDDKYRKERTAINEVLDKTKDQNSEIKPLFEQLNKKSVAIKPIVEDILTLNQNNKLNTSLNDLMSSYIHMMMNRLFKSKQRVHEMVLYDFLYRYYRSEIAKKKFK